MSRSAAEGVWRKGRARLREAYDELQSRYVLRGLDAVLTSGHETSLSAPIPDARSVGNYRRAQRIVNAVSTVFPSVPAHSRRALLTDRLPFAIERVEPLSYGSSVTAFVVRCPAGPRVLKVYRRSLGRPVDALLDEAREARAWFERLGRCYRGCGVLVPTHFLVLHGPLLGRGAAAALQPFVETVQHDVFDLPRRKLVRLLGCHPDLRAELELFTARTLEGAGSERACPDLVGRENLVIAGSVDRLRLLLLDAGGYDLDLKARRAPGALARMWKRVEYLRDTCERVARGSA